jgi:hypothetical protein
MISFGGTASTNGTRAELRAPLGEPIIQPIIAEPAAQGRRDKRLRRLSLRPTQAVPEQEFPIAPFAAAPTGQKVARFSTIKNPGEVLCFMCRRAGGFQFVVGLSNPVLECSNLW